MAAAVRQPRRQHQLHPNHRRNPTQRHTPGAGDGSAGASRRLLNRHPAGEGRHRVPDQRSRPFRDCLGVPVSASRRLIVVLTVLGVVALATVGVGIYGLVRGPSHPSPRSGSPSTGASSPTGTSAGSSGAATGPASAVLPQTDNPVTYAKAVAAALFDWNTTSGYTPSDYTSPVLADADPSGEEMAGLIGDVTSYEPTTAEWTELATMKVIERLAITSAKVPSLWPEALAQARGQLRPGTTAITITGTLHRTG